MTTEKAADLAFELEDVATTIEEAMAVSIGDMIFVLLTTMAVLWWGRWHGSF
ncbi:MAG: hypothetical protein O7G88_04820 [bacterium]|nr:hypothetical protein [bacterium]